MSIPDYIAAGQRTVDGWIDVLDMKLFSLLDERQQSAPAGNLLEIGVYQGKTAILMGYMRRSAETLVVCDLFGGAATNAHSESENARRYSGLELSTFHDNFLRFHPQLPDIIVGPSSSLRQHCAPKSFRFVHVDGSHMYPDVMQDLLLARDLLRDQRSIVVIDDIRGPHTPGVAAAAWECVLNEGLIPLLLSEHKLYATWTDDGTVGGDVLQVLGTDPELTVLEHPLRDRVLFQVARRTKQPSRAGQFAMDWIPAKLRRAFLR